MQPAFASALGIAVLCIANAGHDTPIPSRSFLLGFTPAYRSTTHHEEVLKMTKSLDAIAKEVSAWFFEDYLPTWVAVGAGKGSATKDFILRYWGVPLYTDALGQNAWAMTPQGVVDFLELNQVPLKAQSYTHTVVPDRKVTSYSENGAGIDVIWSRRRADESEVQRLAVHFGAARLAKEGWRVISIQGVLTSESRLDAIWGTAA